MDIPVRRTAWRLRTNLHAIGEAVQFTVTFAEKISTLLDWISCFNFAASHPSGLL